MEINIQIPSYSKDSGMKYQWENNYIIFAEIKSETIQIKANKEGLISLATQLLTLAQDEVPLNTHLHYDELNSLEDGSCEIVIQKI